MIAGIAGKKFVCADGFWGRGVKNKSSVIDIVVSGKY
jgi:hypothetical protein